MDFLVVTEEVLNEDALARLEVALACRGNDGSGSGSKVDTLSITFSAKDPRMRLHARLTIALAGARRTCVFITGLSRSRLNAWSVDLSPAARYLEVAAECHPVAPTVAGPGAVVPAA